MDNDNLTQRSFFHYTKAWYGKPEHLQHGVRDIVTFGMFGDDGSGDAELAVVWYEQGPRLEVFHSSWRALCGMPDVLEALAEHADGPIASAAVCEMLAALGFEDRTPTERTIQ